MHKIHAEECHWYPASTEAENRAVFDDETRLDIFTQVFYNVEGNQGDFTDYRLVRLDLLDHPEQETGEKPKKKEKKSRQISKFLLDEPDRKEMLEVANEAFEHIFERIEPENPELTRQLWDADKYIDNVMLKPRCCRSIGITYSRWPKLLCCNTLLACLTGRRTIK